MDEIKTALFVNAWLLSQLISTTVKGRALTDKEKGAAFHNLVYLCNNLKPIISRLDEWCNLDSRERDRLLQDLYGYDPPQRD